EPIPVPEPTPTPEPTPEPNPQPELEGPVAPLPAANKNTPKAGEFLPKDFAYNEYTSPIVRLHKSTVDNESTLRVEYGVKKVGEGQNFAGIRKVFYNEEGKLAAILTGDSRPYQVFSHKVGEKIDRVTEYRIVDAEDIYDAGLKAGGQYGAVYSSNASPAYFFRDPAVANWNYQTYGKFKATGTIEAESVYQSLGQQTTAAELPTKGSAEYKGISSGSNHKDSSVDLITSDVTIKADFGKRELEFATSNTKTYTWENDQATAADHLDLSGKAAWNNGSGTFKGNIQTADKTMSGQVDGRFYGPQADEAGGVFGVSNADKTENYLGGFGARRE
ncbi:transferrin-binding protein-like solute binding protein, partial [Testudinibacter sp. TR-2022]|uniref:transferrin-binding protein-like solute binding protein n=1 Tax=Testudinibacter sp. TR-2022 TaxID=2585029 RepID=UPI00159BDC60